MGPDIDGLVQKPGRVLVYNRISKDIAYVGVARMQRLLAELGAPQVEPLQKIILSAANGGGSTAKKEGDGGGVVVIREPEQIEAVWKEAKKKGTDSLYPPLSPREFGDYFARLASAKSEDAYQRTIIELDSKLGEWREREDSHSVRYLENLINAIKSEARIARAKRGVVDTSLKRMQDELDIDLSRACSNADEGIKLSQERAGRRLESLEGRLDVFDIKTILRYVAPSVLATGLAAYEALTNWIAKLGFWPKAGVIAGAAGIVAGAYALFRKYSKALISRIEKKAADERKAYGEEGDREQKRLLSEFYQRSGELEDKWAEQLRKMTVDSIVRCFDIAIDFFPDYVANEIGALGVEWKVGFEGERRKEALKILDSGLKRQMPFSSVG